MSTWIFQANPDLFDLRGYLATKPVSVTWLVRQHRDSLKTGETVYLWLAKGSTDGEGSGVVAECRITGAVAAAHDDESSRPFWRVSENSAALEDRVRLLIVRIANGKEVIKRAWFQEAA